MAATPGPTRTAALERMTQALEAAKRARDRGIDVHVARSALREAQSAFMRGDYGTAMERADYIFRLVSSEPVGTPLTGTPPPASSAEVAAARVAQAAESVRMAKAHGFNVHMAKDALKRAKRAMKSGDYPGALALADQAVQLSGSTGRVRP